MPQLSIDGINWAQVGGDVIHPTFRRAAHTSTTVSRCPGQFLVQNKRAHTDRSIFFRANFTSAHKSFCQSKAEVRITDRSFYLSETNEIRYNDHPYNDHPSSKRFVITIIQHLPTASCPLHWDDRCFERRHFLRCVIGIMCQYIFANIYVYIIYYTVYMYI